jgi:hypothetical protein
MKKIKTFSNMSLKKINPKHQIFENQQLEKSSKKCNFEKWQFYSDISL